MSCRRRVSRRRPQGPGRIEFDHVWFAYNVSGDAGPVVAGLRPVGTWQSTVTTHALASSQTDEPDWVLRDVNFAAGKQFRVAPGDTIKIDTLPGDVGAQVELGRVIALMNHSNEFVTGAKLGEAKVTATITNHDRHPKVIVFKFKRKKQYKRTIGHRQNFTRGDGERNRLRVGKGSTWHIKKV